MIMFIIIYYVIIFKFIRHNQQINSKYNNLALVKYYNIKYPYINIRILHL